MADDFDWLKRMVEREAAVGEFPPGGASGGVVAKSRAFARAGRVLAAAEALIAAERVCRERCEDYERTVQHEARIGRPTRRCRMAMEAKDAARKACDDALADLLAAGEP
jgi:hypothetical protein